MMTYEKAELELIRFAAEDVLATSPVAPEGPECPEEDPELPPVEFD